MKSKMTVDGPLMAR